MAINRVHLAKGTSGNRSYCRYTSRPGRRVFIDRAGWTQGEAKAAADAIDDVDELINDGMDGITAANEEMSCWTNDE